MVASVFPHIILSFVNKQGHINPSIQFSHSVMSDSLRPYGLQHTRLPCPSPTPGAYSNSCISSWWCHPAISSSVALLFLPSIFPSIRIFSNESAPRIRWSKYWSFSFNIRSSNEYSGLISFRMDWFDFLAVQGALKSLLRSLLSPPLSVVLLSAVLVIVLNHGLKRLNGKFQKQVIHKF